MPFLGWWTGLKVCFVNMTSFASKAVLIKQRIITAQRQNETKSHLTKTVCTCSWMMVCGEGLYSCQKGRLHAIVCVCVRIGAFREFCVCREDSPGHEFRTTVSTGHLCVNYPPRMHYTQGDKPSEWRNDGNATVYILHDLPQSTRKATVYDHHKCP